MKKIMWTLILLGAFILFYLILIYPAKGGFAMRGLETSLFVPSIIQVLPFRKR